MSEYLIAKRVNEFMLAICFSSLTDIRECKRCTISWRPALRLKIQDDFVFDSYSGQTLYHILITTLPPIIRMQVTHCAY
jgi:hypothetical protein